MIQYEFNPDSAAPIDRKCEAQPFRSKVGFLPLTRYRSTVLGEDTKPHSNDVRECKNDFETSQSDAFAASGFRLAPGIRFTAEYGFDRIKLGIFRLERRKTERRAK